jgi:hypothetical protein
VLPMGKGFISLLSAKSDSCGIFRCINFRENRVFGHTNLMTAFTLIMIVADALPFCLTRVKNISCSCKLFGE